MPPTKCRDEALSFLSAFSQRPRHGHPQAKADLAVAALVKQVLEHHCDVCRPGDDVLFRRRLVKLDRVHLGGDETIEQH